MRRCDSGATAVIIALVMVVLMGIAAVALDGGRAFSEKRQAQAGVDFGSLAALQAAVSCPTPCTPAQAVDDGATEAIAVVISNLPGRSLDWAACTDLSRPAEFTRVSSLTRCVSFTQNLDKSRVRLPDDDIGTTFGGAIGFNVLEVVAQAEAGATIHSSSAIIPHTPNGATGAEACLFSNQAPQTVPPCDGAASGFYGYIDVALYGKDELGTPSTCEQGDTNTRIAINLAKGGDHSFITFDPGPPDPVINDHDACPNANEDINEMRVEPGSPTGGITDGLINGVSGSINGQSFVASPGRIICNLADYSTECASVRGVSLDHTGLWEFLVAGTCPIGTDTHTEMLACLDSGTARFTAGIANHPRFAAVPVFWATPTGPGDYTIMEFSPVWIETIYFDCNAIKCDTVHSPGEDHTPPGPSPGDPGACPDPLDTTRNCGWTDTSGPDDVEGMLAFQIGISMLPSEVTATFPATETERTYALTR